MNFSTIAAISTPHGKGGVSLIRISGNDAFEIADKIFVPFNNKKLSEFRMRSAIYGNILSPDLSGVIDDGLITLFKGPNSFTGEDVAEICCHGGEVISAMVLSSCLQNGAVMAKRGEFSERAFMNGKMTLTAAEGIADLLDAKTEEAAILSSGSARGRLSKKLNNLSEKLLTLSASLWAYIDYPEEDLQTLSDSEMISSLDDLIYEAKRLVDSYKTGRAINSGINTVIVGKPNAGKSTFFNKLLGENKAIVTDIEGTTRDIIEYPVKLGRLLLNLSDTAGLRNKTEDTIEKIGIEKVFNAIEDAELVFALFDSSKPFDENDELVIDSLKSVNENALIIPIVSKCDLDRKLELEKISKFENPIYVNFNDENEFEEIINRCEKYFITDEKMLKEGEILTNIRQKSLCVNVMNLLKEAKENILSDNKDIASLTLENAVATIKEIDGQSAGEEILNEVFSRFCIGK